LIGREEQLERMMARLAFALAGHGSTVLISGEAGVGKTRLAEEFQALVRHIDCLCVNVRCRPDAPDYQPFTESFERCAKLVPGLRSDPSFIRFLIQKPTVKPSKAGAPAAESGGQPSGRLFDAVAVLRSVSTLRPLTISLDDLHLADAKTIQMLHFLARSLGDMKVLLVAAYNDDELFDRPDAPHPLVDVVRIMKREGLCEEIYLAPLTREETRSELEGLFRARFDQQTLDSIYDECGGNPRIAVELAWEAAGRGAMGSVNGLMSLQRNDWLTIPSSLRAWIARKIEVLTAQQREILECAALLGDSFRAEDIATMLGQDRMAVLEKLEVAVREHRLYVESSSSYSFRWGVLRHVALEGIPGPRREALSGRIAPSRP